MIFAILHVVVAWRLRTFEGLVLGGARLLDLIDKSVEGGLISLMSMDRALLDPGSIFDFGLLACNLGPEALDTP